MTDAVLSTTAARAAVSNALQKASDKTGVGFDYLYRVAMRESSLDPQAKAKTSSAAGLFQFIEQTWLSAVKKYGAAHGLSAFAAEIATDDTGRLSVLNAAKKQEILNLRFDADKAAALAGELARENKNALENALGRAVDGAELYAAHFLGAAGAKRLLSADANASAAKLLPAAAKANAHVFYEKGRERTVGEVITSFKKTIGAAREIVADAADRIEKGLKTNLGAQLEALFETSAPKPSAPFLETKSLSLFAITLLQALDPREIALRGANSRNDRARDDRVRDDRE